MKSTKGFTLIELLVVIAIIGILSSVVLASLSSARSKGADAATKAGLASLRAQAEIFYDLGSTYSGFCTNATTSAMLTGIKSSSGAAALNTALCGSTASTWVATAPLKSTVGSHWCVDNLGASISVGATGSSSGACI
jgi:prepilin-type N-terminal cleavage/methylation domain-containing protein